MSATPSHQQPLCGVVVVVLADFWRQHQSWGWLRLVAGAGAYKDVPGLTSAKVMGSGHGGGFSLRPSATHQGLICTFSHLDLALEFLESAAVQAYRSRARECWTGVMQVQSGRGHWDKQAWQASAAEALGDIVEPQGPFAVLTRASIVPTKAMAFWRYAPAAQAELSHAPGCLLAMGLGEAPLVRQCTFSLWKDTESMLAYAQQGAHQLASAAAYKHQFFSESLFVRMRVLHMSGVWQGRTCKVSEQGDTPALAPALGGQDQAQAQAELSHV
ncbi:MAG: Spheroidene monooxygenase [Pseudomonadota bacterium]